MLYIYTYIAFAIFLLYQFLERTHVMMVVGGGELVPNKMGGRNQCSFFNFFAFAQVAITIRASNEIL
jgi:hypothetical protein